MIACFYLPFSSKSSVHQLSMLSGPGLPGGRHLPRAFAASHREDSKKGLNAKLAGSGVGPRARSPEVCRTCL